MNLNKKITDFMEITGLTFEKLYTAIAGDTTIYYTICPPGHECNAGQCNRMANCNMCWKKFLEGI